MALVSDQIVRLFRDRFSPTSEIAVYRAPGRVNLIGEHTDYNLGFVFPIALGMACYVAAAPANHREVRVYSRDIDETFSIGVDQIASAEPSRKWSDYVLGVANQLVAAGIAIEPCDVYIMSEVPAGSGLSSSAALEIASALAFLGDRSLNPLKLAQLGQRAESQFVGMPCGIMDQYASVFGKRGDAIQIDCRELVHEYVDLPPDVRIIAVNSMVKHELGTSAYRERVAECREAVAAIQESAPKVESLRDVSLALFGSLQDSIPATPRRRARHIVSENERVLDLAAAARRNDLKEMGRLFVASHRSMQYDYEISCEEIDFLVDTAIKLPGVYGSRMTGGGFGGCTVNLLAPDAVEEFRSTLSASYAERYSIQPMFYDCEPAAGAGRI